MTAAGFDGSTAARASMLSRCANCGDTICTVLGDADAADQQHHSVARPPGMPLRDAQLHCA